MGALILTSCSDNGVSSSSPVELVSKYQKSESQPLNYMPSDSSNQFVYALYLSEVGKRDTVNCGISIFKTNYIANIAYIKTPWTTTNDRYYPIGEMAFAYNGTVLSAFIGEIGEKIYPQKIPDWTFDTRENYFTQANSNSKFSFLRQSETIVINGEKFSTLVIEESDTEVGVIIRKYYFAKGIGLIKFVGYLYDETVRSELTMISCTLK